MSHLCGTILWLKDAPPPFQKKKKKKVIFPLLQTRKTTNNNVGLRKETFEFLSCDVILLLNYRQYWIRNVKAQLKANTDTFSNYIGSKRVSSRRSVQAKREDTGPSASSRSLGRLRATNTDLARADHA